MAWDFETDSEFQQLLDWADEFVRHEVEPLDYLIPEPRDTTDPVREELIRPLQAEVKSRGLWACHLGPEFGGQGYSHLKMALLNEIVGRSSCAPTVFGCQPPDANTAVILARYGSDDLKRRYLQPLLDAEIYSSFSATEPQGGADPLVFTTRARPDGNDWVIDGEKWFSSGARGASFLVVMAVTDPDAPPHQRMSMFVVPHDTPGIRILRQVATGIEPSDSGNHSHVRYESVRVSGSNMLGDRGQAFKVMQVRMSVARLALATRGLGAIKHAFELMCERANSRVTKGEVLGRKQLVQEMIADSWIELTQFRLLVLHTAWRLDTSPDDPSVRGDIAAVKATLPKVWHNICSRAAQVHGSLGVSHDMPFANGVLRALALGVADGPTEVHKVTLARQVLLRYPATDQMFPTFYVPARRAAARERYAEVLARHGR
jgi:acyl-CoA dehydrogenase